MAACKSNVLYVDDEQENLDAFHNAFRRDYNIFVASSAAQGLEILDQNAIEVLLTDLRMPEMTGVQFMEVVQRSHPDVTPIIVTGFVDIDVVISAINTGRVYRYILKPWDERELKVTIDDAIRSYKSKQATRQQIKDMQAHILAQDLVLERYKQFIHPYLQEEILGQSSLVGFPNGHLRVVCMLLIEIVDFSTAIASLEPKKIVNFFNAYLHFIAQHVANHKGFVNKIFDGKVFIVFGAPVSFIDNPINAWLCSQDILHDWPTFMAEQQFDLELCVAAHFGEVIAGSMLYEYQFDYSIIGQPVQFVENLLRALKLSNQQFGMSEDLYKALEPYHLNSNLSQEEVVLEEDLPMSFFKLG